MDSGYRVLHVTPFFPPDKGGIASHVFHLCNNLSSQGNELCVASPKRIGSQIDADNLRRFVLSSFYLPGWPYPTLRSVSIPADLGLRLDSIIRKGKFDIVHVHGHHYPLSWMAINSAHKYNVPSVLTLHGMYALNPNVIGGKTKVEELLNKYVFNRILGKASAVIGLTKQITDYARGIGNESIRYYTIPNGVVSSLYSENLDRKQEYRSKYNFKSSSIIVLFLGRLEQVKGVIEFAKATANIIRQTKDLEVVIVGEGTLEVKVKSILSGLPSVHILPWQPSDRVHELYIASDIFVIPSRFEALPITVIEAMNAGLHVVYTPVGGIPDILQEYSRKTMLTEVSSEGIANVLSRLTSDSIDSHDKDSISYAKQFDWKIIASQVDTLYSEIRC